MKMENFMQNAISAKRWFNYLDHPLLKSGGIWKLCANL